MSLESLLQQRGIEYEKHEHPKTFTSQQLAHEEHVSGYIVAKPVIIKAGSRFAMCVLAAPDHVDLRGVAKVLQEPNVRLATEAELAKQCPDCELGAEPPVGSMFSMTTIMDVGLLRDEFLVMQAGNHTEAIRMRRDDWQRLCEPLEAPIAAG